MAITKAMRERHMVRKYTDKPIPADIVARLEERIAQDNRIKGTYVKLMVDDTSAFNAAIKLVLAKNVRNYLIMAGDEAPRNMLLDEPPEEIRRIKAKFRIYRY